MKRRIISILIAVVSLTSCVTLPWQKNEPVDFVSEVKPVLEARCLECHHHRYVCAGLNLETKTLAMKGGRTGPVIVPGAPQQSLLYKVLLLGHDNPISMPPSPDPLSLEEQRAIRDWIQQGAGWPENVRLVPPQDWKKPRA
ncbi:MAG: c-type cytochrome domain-containing protein [Verrucomicrobiaceae bacterium]